MPLLSQGSLIMTLIQPSMGPLAHKKKHLKFYTSWTYNVPKWWITKQFFNWAEHFKWSKTYLRKYGKYILNELKFRTLFTFQFQRNCGLSWDGAVRMDKQGVTRLNPGFSSLSDVSFSSCSTLALVGCQTHTDTFKHVRLAPVVIIIVFFVHIS